MLLSKLSLGSLLGLFLTIAPTGLGLVSSRRKLGCVPVDLGHSQRGLWGLDTGLTAVQAWSGDPLSPESCLLTP